MRNSALVAVAGLAGCATVIIVFVALFLGLWLDSLFDQRGPFTILLLILSVPISLYVMLRFTLGMINLMQLSSDHRDSSVTKE